MNEQVRGEEVIGHIHVTSDDVVVDGQSIGNWIAAGGVTVNPAPSFGAAPSVTVTLVAPRVTVEANVTTGGETDD